MIVRVLTVIVLDQKRGEATLAGVKLVVLLKGEHLHQGEEAVETDEPLKEEGVVRQDNKADGDKEIIQGVVKIITQLGGVLKASRQGAVKDVEQVAYGEGARSEDRVLKVFRCGQSKFELGA